MVWVNPDTFEILEYQVLHRSKSTSEWADVCVWCEETIGEQNILWAQTGAEMQVSNCWWFKHNEDAVLFQLTWC